LIANIVVDLRKEMQGFIREGVETRMPARLGLAARRYDRSDGSVRR
jgi:hypothetical protein